MRGSRGAARAAFVLMLACAGAAAAAQAPFAGLSSPELAALARGEAVTRIAKDAKTLALPAGAPGAAEIAATLRKLGPNYVVEVLGAVPGDAASPGAALAAALADPASWVGIPYYSERYSKTFDLFDKSQVRSRSPQAGGEALEVVHHMQPFDDYAARYEYELGTAGLSFRGSNASPLVYKGVRAVGPGEMAWRLAAWKDGDSWWFYGVGAVKAFDMFGAVRDRLEPSFIGRTRAFFDFMRGRLAAKP